VNFGGLVLQLSPDEDRWADELEKLREKLRLGLKVHSDIHFVTDLFENERTHEDYLIQPTIGGCFSPLAAFFHFPPELLDPSESPAEKPPEDYVILLDGCYMLVGTVCQLGKYPVGLAVAPTLRDRLKDLIGEIVPCRIMPPNIAPCSIMVVNGGGESDKEDREWAVTLHLESRATVKHAMQLIYRRLLSSLPHFYDMCQYSDNAYEVATEIVKEQQGLLHQVKDFQQTGVVNFIKRSSMSKEILLKITSLLELQAQLSSIQQEFEYQRSELEKQLRDDKPMKTLFVERLDWLTDLKKGRVDLELLLKIVDHARSEMETFGLVSVTVWAAVVGAVAGAVVTVLISHL